MLDHLRSMAVFAKVVEQGSFRGAARALGLSPSVVSHHVRQLERHLAVTLLYRSTRRLAPSPEGRRLFEACQDMVSAATQGLDALSGTSEAPSGDLRISVPAMLAHTPFVDDLAAFSSAFPKVRVRVSFDDERHNLIEEGFDLAIRIGWLEDSSLKARKYFDGHVKIVASPAYVTSRPPVETPADLAAMEWIVLDMLPGHVNLEGPDGEPRRVECRGRLHVDSATAAKGLAIAGMGLAPLLELDVRDALVSGDLVEVLPSWQPESTGVYAVWPATASHGSLARRFTEFVFEQPTPKGRRSLRDPLLQQRPAAGVMQPRSPGGGPG